MMVINAWLFLTQEPLLPPIKMQDLFSPHRLQLPMQDSVLSMRVKRYETPVHKPPIRDRNNLVIPVQNHPLSVMHHVTAIEGNSMSPVKSSRFGLEAPGPTTAPSVASSSRLRVTAATSAPGSTAR